jgi:hypothetical protein
LRLLFSIYNNFIIIPIIGPTAEIMAVPFTVSIGKLVTETSTLISFFKAFQATGGAADKFDEALNILEGMRITLEWTKTYAEQLTNGTNADQIKSQVVNVERAWKRMDKFLQRFEKGLSNHPVPSNSVLRQKFVKAACTVGWSIKDLAGEVVKLRDAVAEPLQILNHLLMLQMLYVRPVTMYPQITYVTLSRWTNTSKLNKKVMLIS